MEKNGLDTARKGRGAKKSRRGEGKIKVIRTRKSKLACTLDEKGMLMDAVERKETQRSTKIPVGGLY